MKMRCPKCGETAEFTVEAMGEDEQFTDKTQDWRIACEHCSSAFEGEFSRLHKIVLTVLFIIPVSLFWGAFLMYSDKCGGRGLQFFVWVLHMIAGFSAALWLTTRYGAVIVRKQAAKVGVEL